MQVSIDPRPVELALDRALAHYFEPGPGDSLFDVWSPAGTAVAVPGNASQAVSLVSIPTGSGPTQQNEGCLLYGISTGPTIGAVRYILQLNGNTVLESDHQLTPDIWTLYPVRLRIETGPYRLELLAISTTAGATTAVGRLAGWKLSGNLEPRRVMR